MDNVVRGAKDIDLSNLEKAAKDIALFEESVVYHGLAEANIKGLRLCTDDECLTIGAKPEAQLEAIAEGITQFTSRSVEGPYAFVVGPKLWSLMSAHLQGYPVKMQAENILGGPVILSPYLSDKFEDEAYMVSTRGGDLELIIGQDLAVGYESHNPSTVRLYFTGSFTFRILEPAAVIPYNRALEINPNLAEAYMYRGVLHIQMGNKELATKDLETLKTLNQDLADELQYVISNGREKEPEQFFGVTRNI